MFGQAYFELADLAVQLGDDADGGAGGGSERRGDRRGCGQLLGAQGGPDFAGTGGDIALPATVFERGLDRGQAQVGALLGAGGPARHPRRVAVGKLLEGHGWERALGWVSTPAATSIMLNSWSGAPQSFRWQSRRSACRSRGRTACARRFRCPDRDRTADRRRGAPRLPTTAPSPSTSRRAAAPGGVPALVHVRSHCPARSTLVGRELEMHGDSCDSGRDDVRRRRCADRNAAVELVYCAAGAHTFVHIVALRIVVSAPTSDSMSPESL